MAATDRFETFLAPRPRPRRSLPMPTETHVVRAALTGLVMMVSVALIVSTFQALDARVAGLLADPEGAGASLVTNGVPAPSFGS